MDNEKVEVRSCSFGKGLFARSTIYKDEVIADWTGGKVYHALKISDLSNEAPLFLQDHAIQFAEDKYIDTLGIGRFSNHSCEPNSGIKGRFQLVALRDIHKDEEIVWDYAMTEDSDWRMNCQCNSTRCRKIVGAYSMLSEERKQEYLPYTSEWIKEKYDHPIKKSYGEELILDLSSCDISTFTKENIERFFVELCNLIEMKRHGDPLFWHEKNPIPHLKGTSAIQFIETSNIVVHALEMLEAVYVNIFSCKTFDVKAATKFTKQFFGAQNVDSRLLERGRKI